MADSGFEYLKYIPDPDIRKQADDYRQKICPGGILPLDIFNIIEFDTNIEIRPIAGLRSTADTETILLSDFKTILVDSNDFLDPRREPRMRYTLAHELGHICLHKNYTKNFMPATIDEYIKLMIEVDEAQYGRFEYQAYEFAGRLLVPKDALFEEVKKQKANIDMFLNKYPDGINDLILHLAPQLNYKFGVSTDVMERRLDKEGIDFFSI